MNESPLKEQLQVFDINNIFLQNDIFIEPTKSKNASLTNAAKKSSIPIIIDYGSGFTKAGYANQNEPQLSFRTLVSKTKDSKSLYSLSSVATKSKDVDIFKQNYRSPYERNIIQHFGLLESVNDYIFSEYVNHPLIITESLANPEYCRQNLIEQLFECYEVNSLCIGVDSLFANYYNFEGNSIADYHKQNKLILSIGNSCIHIIPILDGSIIYGEIKRVNVGVGNSLELLYKTMNLKYNHMKNYFDQVKCMGILENICECAVDYNNQLKYFENRELAFSNELYSNSITFQNNQYIMKNEIDKFIKPVIIDFPHLEIVQDENEIQRKKDLRKKAADRLREAVQKKKEEKMVKNKIELSDLNHILETYTTDQSTAQVNYQINLNFKIQLEQTFGQNATINDVNQRIKKLKVNLGFLDKNVLEEDKFQYLNVPDQELTADQRKVKRQQQIIKAATDARADKKKIDRQKKDEFQKWKVENPEKFKDGLYEKRTKLIKKIDYIKKQKLEMSQRNSKFNQKRMQKLAQLGADDQKQKEDDNFGMNDDDWDVYRGISKHYTNSDDENLEMKLNEIDLELRELDPEFDDKTLLPETNPYQLNQVPKSIEVGVDRIRAPEILFQPGMIGTDQAGLSDTLIYVLKKFGPDNQKTLLNNIQITGGGGLLKNIKERIASDLYPYFNQFDINISIVNDPVFDSWKGMKKFYDKQPQMLQQFTITKEEYFEKGGSNVIFKQNPFSNIIIERI